MLIFDNFDSLESAQKFAAHVRSRFRKEATVCETREQFDKLDLFPFELVTPIVAVERDDIAVVEQSIEDTVEEFGGQFAGT